MADQDDVVFGMFAEFMFRLLIGGFCILWLLLETFLPSSYSADHWGKLACAAAILLWSGTFRISRIRG